MGECRWCADARVYRQHIARWIAFVEQADPWAQREAMHDLGVALLARMTDPATPDLHVLAVAHREEYAAQGRYCENADCLICPTHPDRCVCCRLHPPLDTWRGTCGHVWSAASSETPCPTCAMRALADAAERQLRTAFSTLCYADKLSDVERGDVARDCFVMASRIQAARDAGPEAR